MRPLAMVDDKRKMRVQHEYEVSERHDILMIEKLGEKARADCQNRPSNIEKFTRGIKKFVSPSLTKERCFSILTAFN